MVRPSLALVVLGLAACVPGRPLPAPIPRSGENLPGREELIALGRQQSYDPNPGASDRAVLDDGIEVTIEPQEGTYRQTPERLARGSIVAQLRNHSDKPLRKWALPPKGRSFWLVYRKGDQWFSAFIADDRNREYDQFDIPTMIHPPTRPWRQSIAQWQLGGVIEPAGPGGGELLAQGLYPWTTCIEQGCCKPLGN